MSRQANSRTAVPAGREPPRLSLTGRAWKAIDAASLALFRIAFGTILVWEVWRYVQPREAGRPPWVEELFVLPAMHFTYPGLEWLAPWPAPGMYWHFAALGLLAAMIAAGLCYRASAALFCLGFTYVALLDKTQYLNHFYLVALVSFLLIFVPANRTWSLDAWLWPRIARPDVPAWTLWLLRFQIAVPYVYGGLAKLNGDWLAGQPMQMWMERMSAVRAYVPAFGELWLALAFSYGGLLLDLLVVPLLLWRKTRRIAFCFAVAFHLTNAILFDIGIFPWLMIAATTLFFEPDWPRNVVDWLWPVRRSRRKKAPTSRRGESQRERATEVGVDEQRTLTTGQGFGWQGFILALLALYVAIQILVPLRHWLYPGDVAWTEEGTYFSWRMMLSDKAATVAFVALDPASGQIVQIDHRRYLVQHQIDRMTRDPEMLREFAAFLKHELRSGGGPDREIHVVALCSLNGRKPQPLVDPKIDLGAEPRRLAPQPYIVPLTEPRRTEPWNLPPSEWPGHVTIPSIR